MTLKKPASVENDAFKSAKWDEVTRGREFSETDAPVLDLLCEWYKIADQAREELADFNNQTAYPSENGDLKPLPQISTLKTASSEIRALYKQLEPPEGASKHEEKHEKTPLEVVQNRRRKKCNVAQAVGQ